MDKEYWKYQGFLWKTAWSNFLEHFEGSKKLSEPFIVAVLTFVFSIIMLSISNGKVSMNDWLLITISTVGGPFIYIISMFLAKRVFASYSIFVNKKNEFGKSLKEKELEFDKALKEKDLELEKYNWDNVEFYVTRFSIIGKSGWAFEIKNNKHYDISKIIIEVTKIRKDEKIMPLSGLYLLGYIDRQRGQIGEKLVNSSKRRGIEVGKSMEFVVTSEVIKTKSSKTHKFETYPDELSWDFPLETSDNFMAVGRSVVAMAAALYGNNSPPEPTTVIEVCIRAEIKVDTDIIQLPGTTENLQVMNDGSLSFYGDEDEN